MITKDELIKEENDRQSGMDDLTRNGWLKVPQAAKYAGCSVTTIYAWMKDPVHPLKSSKKNGRRISTKRLDEYLEQFEQNGIF